MSLSSMMKGMHVWMTVAVQYEHGITRSVQSSRIQWPFCSPLKVTVRCSQSSSSIHSKNLLSNSNGVSTQGTFGKPLISGCVYPTECAPMRATMHLSSQSMRPKDSRSCAGLKSSCGIRPTIGQLVAPEPSGKSTRPGQNGIVGPPIC
jgi:hypothetical protein